MRSKMMSEPYYEIIKIEVTYYIACFQVSPRRLLTAAAMLKTIEANQKQFTESDILARSN